MAIYFEGTPGTDAIFAASSGPQLARPSSDRPPLRAVDHEQPEAVYKTLSLDCLLHELPTDLQGVYSEARDPEA